MSAGSITPSQIMAQRRVPLVSEKDEEQGKPLTSNQFTLGARARALTRPVIVCTLLGMLVFACAAILEGGDYRPNRNRWSRPVEHWREQDSWWTSREFQVDEKMRHRLPVLATTVKEKKPYNYVLELQGMTRTYLFLDKPVYRPGETVRASCFSWDPTTLKQNQVFTASIHIRDGKNVVVASMYEKDSENGVLAFGWDIPEAIPGGNFKITVESDGLLLGSEITFEVRSTRTSNAKINKKIEFAKEGYNAGDQVSLKLVLDNSNEETSVDFTATVNSDDVATSHATVTGNIAQFSFVLPLKMTRDQGVVTAKVRRGALLESVSKTIPIIIQGVDLGLFPEGGVLVAGAMQRVYVEALHPTNGKPVDFVGEIFSDVDPQTPLAIVESLHEGRGVSSIFTVPGPATRVFFQIISPSSATGQTKDFPLRIKEDLVALLVEESVFQDILKVEVISPHNRRQRLTLEVYKMSQKLIKIRVEHGKVELNLKDYYSREMFGVLRVTVLNRDNLPIAERLVFRMPTKGLEIQISASTVPDASNIDKSSLTMTPNKLQASPADGVALHITTWERSIDAISGEFAGVRVPVPAVIFFRVTDSALAATVEDRLLPPRLPEALLLESEVDRLNGAGQFIPGSSWAWTDKSASVRGTFRERLDLLMGTQGWRMFAYHDVERFLNTGLVPLVPNRLVPAAGDFKQHAVPPSPVSKNAISRLICLNPFRRWPDWSDVNTQRSYFEGLSISNSYLQRAGSHLRGSASNRQDVLAMVDATLETDDDDDVVNSEQVAKEAEHSTQDSDDYATSTAVLVRKRKNRPFERVYAHAQRKYTKAEFEQGIKRTDFTETVYFNPSLLTSCTKDECSAQVAFGLSESSSATFIAHADGFVPLVSSTLGCSHMKIEVSAPLEVDFTLPSVIVSGDRPVIPVSVMNRRGGSLELRSSFAPRGLLKTNTETFTVTGTSSRVYVELVSKRRVKEDQKEFEMTMEVTSTSSKLKDAITRTGMVIAKGFPTAQFAGGSFKASESTHDLVMPDDYIPATLEVVLKGYTSPVGRLNKALEALIQEPCGCFEQTSSTTYPLVFVVQYLKTHSGSDPKLISKAQEMLKKGYDRLVSYESKSGGFEWFGESPGHEALTAYGLLQFAAMSDPSVGLAVDKSMVERTKKWMDSRRDGKGGFERSTKALDSFGAAPPFTTNAYITWALVRAGLLRPRTRDVEIESLISQALKDGMQDPYIVALAALSLYDAVDRTEKDSAKANKLADKLVTMQDDTDGALRRGTTDTITRSQGEALEIEATALGVLVWLHDSEKYATNARMAIDFISSKCKNGRFASTQATALSLMAIVEFDRVFSKPLPKGRAQVSVNGKVIETLRFGGSRKKRTEDEQSENVLGSTAEECKGGSVFTSCGTACPVTCDSPEPKPCISMCVPGCQCPQDKPFMTNDHQCVAKCESPFSDVDEEGVLNFNGQTIAQALEPLLKEKNQVSLKLIMDDEKVETVSIPYSLAFKYSVIKPKTSPKWNKPLSLALDIKLDSAGKNHPKEGDVVTITATLSNLAKDDKGEFKGVPMVVAVIGIPGGCEPRTDQLRELKQSGVVDFVETRPGQVILYWRGMNPRAVLNVPIQVTAVVPGVYDSPASKAYLFYTEEDKAWADGFQIRIDPQMPSQSEERLFW